MTEPGRGYRFVASVEAVPAVTESPVRAETAAPPHDGTARGASSTSVVVQIARRWIERDAAAITAIGFAACGVFRDGGSSRRAGAALVWFLSRDTDARWLQEELVPQIEAHLDTGNFEAAYALAQEAEARVPDDPELLELWPRLSWLVTLESDRPGSGVSARVQRHGCGLAGARAHAVTGHPDPLRFVAPALGARRICADARTLGGGGLIETSLLPTVPGTYNIAPELYKLDRTEELPEGKVRVSGFDQVIDGASVQLRDYFLDRYEVTNAQFKAFVDAGGYRQPRLWARVVRDGQIVPWDEAMTSFTDRTGRPGPSTWEAGDYPDGQDQYPVSGVSWYEADAYAPQGPRVADDPSLASRVAVRGAVVAAPGKQSRCSRARGGRANRGDELQRHVRHDRQRQRVECIGARRPARDSRRRLARPGLGGAMMEGTFAVAARSIAEQRPAIGRDPRRAGRRGARASCAPAVVVARRRISNGLRRSVFGVQQSVRYDSPPH